MPIYEFNCPNCGAIYEEVLLNSADTTSSCPKCGTAGTKIMSAGSNLNGKDVPSMPDSKSHGCCGNRPGESGCIPGSCCGRAGR